MTGDTVILGALVGVHIREAEVIALTLGAEVEASLPGPNTLHVLHIDPVQGLLDERNLSHLVALYQDRYCTGLEKEAYEALCRVKNDGNQAKQILMEVWTRKGASVISVLQSYLGPERL